MRDPYSAAQVLETLSGALEDYDIEHKAENLLQKYYDKIVSLMPKDYFPDIKLTYSLRKDTDANLSLEYDHFAYNCINYDTDGEFFKGQKLLDLTNPEYSDYITGYVFENDNVVPFSCEKKRKETQELTDYDIIEKNILDAGCPRENIPPDADFFVKAGSFSNTYDVRYDATENRLTLAYDIPKNVRRYGEREDYIKRVSVFLDEHKLIQKQLEPYLSPVGNYEIPFLMDGKFKKHYLNIRLSNISFSWVGEKLEDISISLLASLNISLFTGKLCRPSHSFQWHITDICDQRCKHCYLFGTDPSIVCYSTPYEKLLHTMDEMTEYARRNGRYPIFYITGGDPILHPQFWQLAEELYKRGIRWALMGNPFHLTDEVCQRLHNLGCHMYQLSLDGQQEFHDNLRKPGSYAATLQAVAPLKKAGIATQFMATASRDNLEDILVCMDIAKEVGVDSFVFARYCAISAEDAKKRYPSPEEYRDFLLRYYEKRKYALEHHYRTRFGMKEHLFTLLQWELGDFKIPAYAKENPDTIYAGCHLGDGVTVLPNGDLLACRRMDSCVGNVNEEHIYDVVNSDRIKAYADVKNITKCKDCELLNWCRGCRAVGYNMTGDLQCADPVCWYDPYKGKKE